MANLKPLAQSPPVCLELEQIYKSYIAIVEQAKVKQWLLGLEPDSSEFLQKRLTNRYIERATRRVFAPVHFTIWSINVPNDGRVREFCDMASTPDLGKYLTHLDLHFDNDNIDAGLSE